MRVQGNLKSLSMFVVVVGIMLAMGLFAPTACAETIEIDSFTSPGAGADFYSFSLLPGLPPAQPQVLVDGGRTLTAEVVGDPNWKSIAGTIGSPDEALSVATWGDPASRVTLDYTSWAGKGDTLNLTDGGANNAIAFAFNFLAGNDLNVKMTVVGDGGTAVFDSATSTLGNVTPMGTSFSYAAPFDEFVIDTGDPLGNADTINIVLNDPGGIPLANVNFELTSVVAVPEPSTLAMLLMVGVASLLAVARRRQER